MPENTTRTTDSQMPAGERFTAGIQCEALDRGREKRLNSNPPPSEPDRRISRIRLSSRRFYLREDFYPSSRVRYIRRTVRRLDAALE